MSSFKTVLEAWGRSVKELQPFSAGICAQAAQLQTTEIFEIIKTLEVRKFLRTANELSPAEVLDLPAWVVAQGGGDEALRDRFDYHLQYADRHDKARLQHVFEVNALWPYDKRQLSPFVGLTFLPSYRTDSFGEAPIVPQASARALVVSVRTAAVKAKGTVKLVPSFDLRILSVDFDAEGAILLGSDPQPATDRVYNWNYSPKFGGLGGIVDLDHIEVVEAALAATRAMQKHAAAVGPAAMPGPVYFDVPAPWLVYRAERAPQANKECPRLLKVLFDDVVEWCATGRMQIDGSNHWLHDRTGRSRVVFSSAPTSVDDIRNRLTAEEFDRLVESTWAQNSAESEDGLLYFNPAVVPVEEVKQGHRFLDFRNLMGRGKFNPLTGETDQLPDKCCIQVLHTTKAQREEEFSGRRGRICLFDLDATPPTQQRDFCDETDQLVHSRSSAKQRARR